MSNLKKILAMALTVLMVVGSFAMTATASFDDVTDYQEAIDVMYALGIACGKSETEFAPDDDVTREEMALWIAKIMTGKVDSTYVTNNFLGAVENLTAFADLDEDNYVGAINYAANNGIIVGTSATTFEASEAIKIQDVFAMVVRMLGYGSTAMNNNYPWSFIDKAISLGLDADLPADYSNEAAASRGETMQILYNALTALKSDGSTLGYDFFGLEKATVVITGTVNGNMYNGSAEKIAKTVDDVDYVAFALLNADGTVADTTYYALKTEFGIEADANPDFYVGDSFVVRTVDGFVSFLTCEACESIVVDQAVITGDLTNKSPAYNYVDVDGTSYKLVKKYSDFVTGTKTTNDAEIIFVNAGTYTKNPDLSTYKMDADLNILDEDGEILLHWTPTYGQNTAIDYLNGVYLYELSDGSFVQPNEAIWALAAKYYYGAATSFKGFSVIENSYSGIESLDAYSDTVLYDDDNDGDWDRAIYYQYKFGKITVSSDYLYAAGVKLDADTKAASLKYYTADGEAIALADIKDKYVLYWYNDLYNTIIVKEIFEGQTGLVTGVDLVNNTITFNAYGSNFITGLVTGEKYDLGNKYLDGAQVDDIKISVDKTDLNLHTLMGKNINFIEKDGMVLAIYNAVDDAGYMIYVKNEIGYTTMGYEKILAYYDVAAGNVGATQAVVTVNAVNGYWYSNYNGLVSGVLNNNEPWSYGDLLKVTKDALGNYDIIGDGESLKVTVPTGEGKNVITINNGIASGAGITPFAVATSTVWVIWDNQSIDGFKTFVGIPNNGATITVTGNLYVNGTKFVYAVGHTNASTATINPWGNAFDKNSTIIYADVTTIASMQMDTPNGMYVGATFSYTKAIDMINGGYTTAVTSPSYNAALELGNFYEVKNGYIVRKIDLEAADSPVKQGYLLGADKFGQATPNWGYSIITADTIASKTAAKKTIYASDVNATESKVNEALPVLYYNDKPNDTYGDAPNDILIKNASTSSDAIIKDTFNALNDVTTDDKDTALVVYYAKLGNAPIFLATGSVELALEAPADPAEYTVVLFGYDANKSPLNADDFTALYNDNQIEVYNGKKMADGVYNIINKDTPVELTKIGDVYQSAVYADLEASELPVYVIAVKNDLKLDEWTTPRELTISYVRQDVAEGPYRSQIAKTTLINSDDFQGGYTYYALEITEDMVKYDATGLEKLTDTADTDGAKDYIIHIGFTVAY